MYRPIRAIQLGGMNSSASPDLLKESDFRELINVRQVKQGKLVTREGVVLGAYLPVAEQSDSTGASSIDPFPWDPKSVLSMAEGIAGIGEFILPSIDASSDTDRYMVYAMRLRGALLVDDGWRRDDREYRLAFILVPLNGTHRDMYLVDGQIGFDPTFFSFLPHYQSYRTHNEDKIVGYGKGERPTKVRETTGGVKLMTEDGHYLTMTMFANKLVISDAVNGDMLLQWYDQRDRCARTTTFDYALTANTIDRFDVDIVSIDDEVQGVNSAVENGMALYRYKLKESYYKHTEDHFNNKFGFIFGTNMYDGFGRGQTIKTLDPNAGTKDVVNTVATAAGVAAEMLGLPMGTAIGQVLGTFASWIIGDGPEVLLADNALPGGIASIRQRMESIFSNREHMALFTAAVYSRIGLKRLQEGSTIKYMHRGHRYIGQPIACTTLADIMKDDLKEYYFSNALFDAYRYDDIFGDLEFAFDEFDRTTTDDNGIRRTERVREKAADVYIWEDHKVTYYPCSGKEESPIGYQYVYGRDLDFDKKTPLTPRVVAFEKKTGREIEVPVGMWEYRFVWDYDNNEFSAPSSPVVVPDVLYSAVPDVASINRKVTRDGYVEYHNALADSVQVTMPTTNPRPEGYDDYLTTWEGWYALAWAEGDSERANEIYEPDPPVYPEPLTPMQIAETLAYDKGYHDGYNSAPGTTYRYDGFPTYFPPELYWEPVTKGSVEYPPLLYVPGIDTIEGYERYINPHAATSYSVDYSALDDGLLFDENYQVTTVGKLLFALKQKVYPSIHRFNPEVPTEAYDANDPALVAARKALADHYADFAAVITLKPDAAEMPLNGNIMVGADLDFWDSGNVQPYRVPLYIPIFPTSGTGLNSLFTDDGRLRLPFIRNPIEDWIDEDGELVNWDFVRPNKMLVFPGENTIFDRNRKARVATSAPGGYTNGKRGAEAWVDHYTSEFANIQALTGIQKVYMNFLRLEENMASGKNNNPFPFDTFGSLFPYAPGSKMTTTDPPPSYLMATTDDNNTNSDRYDIVGHTVYDTYIRAIKSIADELSVTDDEVPAEAVERLVLAGVGELPLVTRGERLFYNTEYRHNPPQWVNGNSEREGDLRLIRTGMPTFAGLLGRPSYTSRGLSPSMSGALDSLRNACAYNDAERFNLNNTSVTLTEEEKEEEMKANTVQNLGASIYLQGERFLGVEQLTSYFPSSLLFDSPRYSLFIDKRDIPRRARRLLVFRTLSTISNSYQPDRYGLVGSLEIERSTGEAPYTDIDEHTPVYYDDAAEEYKEGFYFFDDVQDRNLSFLDDVERYDGLTEPLKSKYNISIDNRMVFANYEETYQPPTPRGNV